MKLVNFIKMIDVMNDCILFDVDKNETIWTGPSYLLEAAFDKAPKQEQFFKECMEDEDYNSIALTKMAMPFRNYKLDRNEDGEAVMFFPYVNSYGVACLKMQINIKKC